MFTPNFNSDIQKNDLMNLIVKVKSFEPALGAYIEHFYYNDNIIIIKLTNGFIKVSESILEKHQSGEEVISEAELKKIGNTFVKTLL